MPWFDATQVDPASPAANFPVGIHVVCAKSSAEVATKDNSGGMLVFQLEILDGPSKGFVGPYRLNLWNTNQQAAEIAHRQLSAMCHVCGTYQLNGQPKGVELFGKPFKIIVQPQEDPKYTQVVAVTDVNGNPAVKGQAPASPPAQQQQQPASWGPPAAPAAAPQEQPPAWGAPKGSPGPGGWPGAQQSQQSQQSGGPASPPPWAAPQGGTAPWGNR